MIDVRVLSTRGLRDVTFTVPRGGYGVVIGPAGAGKTTLLETIAGIVPVRGGSVWLGGADLTAAPPEARRLSIVYQHAYLFPHLTVGENVGYGAESPASAREMAQRFGLGTLLARGVATLSGGERQIVALARALARRPEVLLLDEPFSALDAFTRFSLQDHLLDIWRADQPTMLFVTHDIEESLVLSDRVVVMRAKPGRIHAQYRIDLPRPRRRTEAQLQSWKERILEDLDLAQKGADAEPEFAI